MTAVTAMATRAVHQIEASDAIAAAFGTDEASAA